MVTYSKEAVAHAKKNGLHLLKIELNGRHAKKGTWSVACVVGPETAAKINALLTETLCHVKEREK